MWTTLLSQMQCAMSASIAGWLGMLRPSACMLYPPWRNEMAHTTDDRGDQPARPHAHEMLCETRLTKETISRSGVLRVRLGLSARPPPRAIRSWAADALMKDLSCSLASSDDSSDSWDRAVRRGPFHTKQQAATNLGRSGTIWDAVAPRPRMGVRAAPQQRSTPLRR